MILRTRMEIVNIIDIDANKCDESQKPCLHIMKVELEDGRIVSVTENAREIYKLCLKFKHPIPMHINFAGSD